MTGTSSRCYRLIMGARRERPVPDLTGSTLKYVGDNHYVDTVTGLMLSRIGHPSVHGYEKALHEGREEFVHRIVAEAVHGPCPAGRNVNHRDGVKSNNRPDNLEYVTQGEQIAHSYAAALRPRAKHPNSGSKTKLTPEQIEAIRSAPAGSVQVLAKQLGISRGHAYNIRGGFRCPASS